MAHAKFRNSAATLQVVLTLISLKVNWSFSGRVALSLQCRLSSFIGNCLYLLRNPQEQMKIPISSLWQQKFPGESPAALALGCRTERTRLLPMSTSRTS